MKKLLSIFLCAVLTLTVLSLFACGSSSVYENDPIIGTWDTPASEHLIISATKNGFKTSTADTITKNEDGTYTEKDTKTGKQFILTLDGDTITFINDDLIDNKTITWTRVKS